MFTMPRRGIVNVKMVITEEKILSNIEKVQRLINPNSKKQIIELDDNSYFKDLVESIKTYLVEYPKKKNFPKSIYDAAYKLVEYATNQFEENTKQVEKLIKQREMNIKTAAVLKQTLAIVESKDPEWHKAIAKISGKISEDVIQALNIVGKNTDKQDPEYMAALKLINARIVNLESNLHIEIDMERVEDRSKALSYIGIEIADALKLIPAPVEAITVVNNAKVQAPVQPVVQNNPQRQVQQTVQPRMQPNIQARPRANVAAIQNNAVVVNNPNIQAEPTAYENYYADTRREVRESLWNKFKNSKFMRAVKYALRIKVILQLPEGLPQGNEQNRF